jgi:hypothetical protein
MERSLMQATHALYASEINCSVSSFWDGGWLVQLGGLAVRAIFARPKSTPVRSSGAFGFSLT